MIGKVYTVVTPYYDRFSQTRKFKSRPCLIIGQADSGDYVILPISSVSDKSKIDEVYDIPLDTASYAFLHKDCYLRTHKQTIANLANFREEIADFRVSYEETYHKALILVEQFQKQLISNAL